MILALLAAGRAQAVLGLLHRRAQRPDRRTALPPHLRGDARRRSPAGTRGSFYWVILPLVPIHILANLLVRPRQERAPDHRHDHRQQARRRLCSTRTRPSSPAARCCARSSASSSPPPPCSPPSWHSAASTSGDLCKIPNCPSPRHVGDMPPAWERTRGHDLRTRAPCVKLHSAAGAAVSHSAELVRGDLFAQVNTPSSGPSDHLLPKGRRATARGLRDLADVSPLSPPADSDALSHTCNQNPLCSRWLLQPRPLPAADHPKGCS